MVPCCLFSLRTEFQQQAGDLSSQLTKCKLEMNALSESVSKTKAANHELQVYLFVSSVLVAKH